MADYGIDPTSSLRSRIGPPTDLVVATYVEAGASDITAHTMTDEDGAIVERALSRLPALHQKILQQRLRRLSFVDLRPGAGSALTSPAGPIATATAFDMTFRSSLLRESLSDFLNTKEANLFEDDASGTRIQFDAGQMDALTFVLFHEATHVVDTTLGLTADAASPFRVGVWETPRIPAAPYADSLAAKTWFRGAPKIPLAKAADYYRALSQTPFVTFYAATTSAEDLAELTAWQQLAARFGQTLTLTVLDGQGRTAFRYEPLNAPLVRPRFAPVATLLEGAPAPVKG